ncbi:VWA domain-containing protein [Acidicapsa dinghuensis]|uniref:VWA domain-containing protein n=1 Tax=Acidicapsa dinghuensis TaxID=2218256 RepID=A0ABW1EMJ1_9BACT|nr:VWA domain-containing protein [Acidicapsa dinghuensis]
MGYRVEAQANAAARLAGGPAYTGGDSKSPLPKFPNVDVVFSLAGADGNPIMPKPADLKLYSQGKEIGTATSIRSFEATGNGLTAILALDASGSMRGAPINSIHATISKFVQQARPQDKVAVVTFADDVRTDVPFGASKSALAQELDTVQARGKLTRLYDALLQTMDQFNSNLPVRRLLTVISDGHDEGSEHALVDVIAKAKSMGIVVDCIGLNRDNGAYLSTLQQLADQTGGTYRHALNAQDLDTYVGQGIQITRMTPVASFKTSHLPTDDSLHSVQLRWMPGKLTATVFIRTPKSTAIQNFWLWGLGACFLAGVILLSISWFGARGGTRVGVAASQPLAQPGPQLQTPPIPGSYPSTPIAPSGFPGPFGQPGSAGSRTPTVPETGAAPLSASSLPVQRLSSTEIEPKPTRVESAPILDLEERAERTRTKLAVYFEAADVGPYGRLAVQNGPLAGQVFKITSRIFRIGAVVGNELILPDDPTVSSHHARLFWEGAILKVEDQNSLNGTYVNGSKLTSGRHLLRPGDEIQLGQTKLVLEKV